MARQKQNKQNITNLAGGQRRANFVIGANEGDEIQINPGILAPEEPVPAFTSEPVIEAIDRSRPFKKISPKGDMILVKRKEPENLSAGGLIIPDEGKDRPSEGTVISVGSKVTEGIKKGDHIIFGKYAGTEYPWGTETLLFMREEEIIATVEEEGECGCMESNKIIDIHPLDLGDILNRAVTGENDGTDVLICKGGKYKTEIIEYQGKTYRQTVDVPVTSAYGKKILAGMEE